MNYWMSRISHHQEYSLDLLQKEQILSIGFSDLTKEKTKEKVLAIGESKCSDWFYGSRRGSLSRFLDMQVGDWVLVPHPWGGEFSIYEIESPFMNQKALSELLERKTLTDWNEEEEQLAKIDLGFFYKVKPIAEDISRAAYLKDRLRRKLKAFTTTLNLTDVADEIKDLVKNVENETPVNHKQDMLERMAEPLLKTIEEMSPDRFEKLVMQYFEQTGATYTYKPAKNACSTEEGDVDVIADFEHLRHRIYVQVKRHEGQTNEYAMQQLQSYIDNLSMDEGMTAAFWVISSASSFSEAAKELALELKIILINDKDFATMLINAGLREVKDE